MASEHRTQQISDTTTQNKTGEVANGGVHSGVSNFAQIMKSSFAPPPEDVLQLQRTIGNRATQELFRKNIRFQKHPIYIFSV